MSTRTPTYRLEMTDNKGSFAMGWDVKAPKGVPHYTADGKPTIANLERKIKAYEESTQPGGVNAHLGVCRVSKARIIRQATGEVMVEYKAPMFEVV